MFYNTVSKYADKKLYYHKVDGDWIGITGSEIKETVENLIDTFLEAGKTSLELRSKGLIKKIKSN